VLVPSSISSTDQPTTPMEDITRPSAMLAQNSHWHPTHTWRRRTITHTPIRGGMSNATIRNHGSTAW